MSPQPPPPGIYVPVPTFFESDSGALDLKLQCSHATFLAKSGIKGLVLCGSTGEAPHMTKNERSNLFSKVRTHLTENGVGQEFPIIAGVTSENIEDAIADLKAASEHASHGLVLVPSYFASAGKNVHYQEGLVNWFQKVADGSPIPILIYHYPAVSNAVQVSMSTYTRLAAHLNIVGAKLSHGDISRHIQLSNLPNSLNDKFFIFTGLGQQLFPMLSMGGHGAIDGLAGIFPKVIVHLYNLTQDYVNGNTKDPQSALQSIRQLQTLVSQAEEFVVEWGTVGIKVAVGMVIGSKHHLSQQQLQCRSPLQGGMPAVEWEKWENGVFGDMKRKVEELEHQA